jgi:hydrogenase/urease accessory protein HupE
MKPRRAAILVWLLWIGWGVSARAHDLGVARVELREGAGGHYEFAVTTPPLPDLLALRPILPPRCALEGSPTILKRPGVTVMRFQFLCDGPPLGPGDTLRLPWKREGAFVAATWYDGSSRAQFFGSVLGKEERGIEVRLGELRGPPLDAGDVAARYFLLGLEHILTGWDHLSFVFCLCLVARGWRLVKLVTGFTLGHSLSLALAAFDVVHLPAPPVEACIAMSIAFMAREALLPQDQRRHGAGLVLAFGLLHGLGFAGALKEVGIGARERLLGLLTFNLGVETGQLLFVVAVLGCMAVAAHLPRRRQWRSLCASGLGMVSVFWTLQRIGAFSPLAMALAATGLFAAVVARFCVMERVSLDDCR